MDTEKIQKICDDYLAYYESDDYFEDNDWRYYIFETVLKAVFGDDIFDRFRKIDKQKEIRRKQKEIERLQSEIE